jgi:hypothetical protein
MEIVFVKQDSVEWLFMLCWLELEVIEYDVWEYVGSYRQDGKTVHEFKHTSTHKLISLEASETFTNDQIERIQKIN